MGTTTSPFAAIIPFGAPNISTVYVSGSNYTTNLFRFKVIKRLNQPGEFEAEFWGLSGTEFNVVAEGKTIMFFDQDLLFFKGEIARVEPGADYKTRVTGLSSASAKLRRRIVDTRREYIGSSTKNIFINILSSNFDGASPFVVGTGTMTNFGGSPTIRAEMDNRLSPIDTLSNTVGADWWESYSGPTYSFDMLNIGSFRGATTSRFSFFTGGSLQNSLDFTKKTEQETLVNKVVVLGYGDGPNQVSGVAIDSSSQTTNGVWEKVFVDPTVKESGWAGSMAQDILDDFKNPPLRGILKYPSPFFVAGSEFDVGDVVDVTDNPTKMSGSTFRILYMERTWGFDGDMLTMDLIKYN